MFRFCYLLLVVSLFRVQAEAARTLPTHFSQLSEPDLLIYQETLPRCQGGKARQALGMVIDMRIVNSAATNIFQMTTLNPAAIQARTQSNFLSPENHRLSSSDGFWLALSDCFGDSKLKANLMRQMVEVGHAASESIGTMASFYLVAKMGLAMGQLNEVYPLAARFLAYGVSILAVHRIYFILKYEYFTNPTSEEQAQIDQIGNVLFQDIEASRRMAISLAQQEILKLNQLINDPALSAEERNELLLKKQKIEKLLRQM